MNLLLIRSTCSVTMSWKAFLGEDFRLKGLECGRLYAAVLLVQESVVSKEISSLSRYQSPY